MTEALWHVVRRNEAASAGDVLTAWRENLILEAFYAPVLDTPSYITPSGSRWPEAQRANAARQAEADHRPYVSGAGPYPIYAWSKPLFWTAIALAIALVMVIFLSAGRQQQPQG